MIAKANNICHKSIEITQHAMQRLQERVISYGGFRSWQHLVKTARYEGRNEYDMTADEYLWYRTHFNYLHKSSQVRIMDGFAYLFMGNKGHARTLVTVVKVA